MLAGEKETLVDNHRLAGSWRWWVCQSNRIRWCQMWLSESRDENTNHDRLVVRVIEYWKETEERKSLFAFGFTSHRLDVYSRWLDPRRKSTVRQGNIRKNRTFSMIKSFINVIARIATLLERLGWSRIFTINSAPPCSRKFSWDWGKFRKRVESVKRKRRMIVSLVSAFNSRRKYWTKPRFNAFLWTWGLLKRRTYKGRSEEFYLPLKSST